MGWGRFTPKFRWQSAQKTLCFAIFLSRAVPYFQKVKSESSPTLSRYGSKVRGFQRGVFVRGGGNLNNWGGLQHLNLRQVPVKISEFVKDSIRRPRTKNANLIIATGARTTPMIEISPPHKNPPLETPKKGVPWPTFWCCEAGVHMNAQKGQVGRQDGDHQQCASHSRACS